VTLAEFVMRPIGAVTSPYKDTKEIPKGFGVTHEAGRSARNSA
jgi:hypothetical protein